jgi:hypothetical protein
MAVTVPGDAISERLEVLVTRGRVLEAEGVPYPTDQVREAVQLALAEDDEERAQSVLRRAETLYSKAARDWMWVRELLTRADELRELAERVGVDVTLLEARVGNPREQLRKSALSAGSLERAAASASLALAILNDAIPKFCVQEAQKLGSHIRRARDRGEEVTEATAMFGRLLTAIQEEQLAITGQRLVEARRAVARIPPAPAMGQLPSGEEDAILREARSLARRLHRIKGKARDAQSAARLMSQVRAALSEDRRVGTPEEEIEDLWNEVDRLTKERALARGRAALAAPEAEPPVPTAPEVPLGATLDPEDDEEPDPTPDIDEPPPEPPEAPSIPSAVGIVPPALPAEGQIPAERPSGKRRARERSAST